MLKINWKLRLQSKAFWVSVFALIGFIIGELGIYDAGSYQTLVDTILLVLVTGGVIVDHTTPGIADSERSLRKERL